MGKRTVVYLGKCPWAFKMISPSEYVHKDGDNTLRVYFARGSWHLSIMQFVGGPKPWEVEVLSGFKTKEDTAQSLKWQPAEEE